MGINLFIVVVFFVVGLIIVVVIFFIVFWKWLFLINVPLGIIVLFLVMCFLLFNGFCVSKFCFDLFSVVMNVLIFGLFIIVLSGFV